MRKNAIRLAVLSVAFLTHASTAWGQTALNSGEFQVERFEPFAAQGTSILNVGKSDVLPHLKPSVGLFVHYANDPIVLRGSDDSESKILSDSLNLEVLGGIGFFGFLDLGVAIPLVAYQAGENLAAIGQPGSEPDSFALQDIRITPRLQFLDPEEFGGFGVALMTTVGLPVGDDLNTDGSVRIEPRVAIDYRMGEFALATNLAYAFRDQAAAQDYVADDVFRWSVGFEIPTGMPRFQGIGSVFGDANMADRRDPNNLTVDLDESPTGPIEWLLGLQYSFENDLVANIGGGTGLNSGVGSPDFRIFSSLSYTPRSADSDGDGIMDSDDACPQVPEDIDGFEDANGCPDDDNDQDTIPDAQDQCPDQAEDRDGFEDENGCPDPDNDQDQILDVDDACPDEAGVPEKNGCPLRDKDGDGILDENDQCPEEPEDKDGFQDTDGCADPDNDQDSILDADDTCPLEAEDKDGFEDEDGCPDPDNDKDGVLDVDDKCPLEAEIINGVDDEDGCPDKGKSKVRITKTKIEILERVYFDTGKATIKERSHNLLNQVAQIIKANAQITKVQIEGHTDDRGADEFNLELSQQRADAVKAYVLARGIDEDRVIAKGFGETKPIADNSKSAGRSQNRRVEFNILEVNGKAVGADGAIIEKKEVIEDAPADAGDSTKVQAPAEGETTESAPQE